MIGPADADAVVDPDADAAECEAFKESFLDPLEPRMPNG